MDVLQTDLMLATGGVTYSGIYNLCVVRGRAGNSAARCQDNVPALPLPGNNTGENAYINFEVVVPELLVAGGLTTGMPMSYSSGSDASAADTFCIGRNTSDDIVVTAESTKTTAGGTFMMEGLTDTGKTLVYSVNINGTGLTEGGTGVAYGSSDGVRSDLNCAGDNGMDIEVISLENAVLGATAQTYSDTLTLTVEIAP
jgi:hypothetical protein